MFYDELTQWAQHAQKQKYFESSNSEEFHCFRMILPAYVISYICRHISTISTRSMILLTSSTTNNFDLTIRKLCWRLLPYHIKLSYAFIASIYKIDVPSGDNTTQIHYAQLLAPLLSLFFSFTVYTYSLVNWDLVFSTVSRSVVVTHEPPRVVSAFHRCHFQLALESMKVLLFHILPSWRIILLPFRYSVDWRIWRTSY